MIWHAIAAAQPQLFLFLGDNVYQSEETAQPGLKELREAYAALARDQPFAQLRAQTPVLAVWDDHDYGLNDAGAEFPLKHESEALFEQVWAIAAQDPRRGREGVYHQQRIGPEGRTTQVILLDTRFFRVPAGDPEQDRAGTMLGDAQWQWLASVLRQPARVRVVASSIPVLSRREAGESWHHWPTERERLIQMITSARSDAVVLISGDSHFGAFYDQSRAGRRPLVELTSSALNFPLPKRARESGDFRDPARRGAVHFAANFATIEIDWSRATLSLGLHAATGVELERRRVPMAARGMSPTAG
ncbi:MAG: alkaline phosphatase family protein [Myxococcales bacterium FL481]|nr:MAG: alkaline phosphatase family protein [Myxococcales bacterium FL481]